MVSFKHLHETLLVISLAIQVLQVINIVEDMIIYFRVYIGCRIPFVSSDI